MAPAHDIAPVFLHLRYTGTPALRYAFFSFLIRFILECGSIVLLTI